MLRPHARQGHIVPSLAATLISVASLCHAGYQVLFTNADVQIIDSQSNQVVLQGQRDPASNLWHIPSQATGPAQIQIHSANKIGDPTEADLIAYAHATLFSPVLSRIEFALRNNFLTNFPGLTTAGLRRNPPQSIATAKGHQDQTRQNLRSTKTKPTIIPNDDTNPPIHAEDDDLQPNHITARTHQCYATFFAATGQVYTDQTGKFVSPSSTGNNYIMILYDYDSNHIFAEPFPNRQAATILKAYQRLHQRLCLAGLKPQLQRLDNECSTILKNFLHASEIDFQLVPPGMHRRNSAERAIRTFQNHFIAGLCSTDKDFPIHLWDQILPQAEITLNLMRASRLNPKLSAYAQICGQFDYNRTPMGPPGCRVLAHEKPATRQTWAPHGLDGWYVGPAMDSYRCYRIWIYDTRAIRICDTVTWFPTKVRMPDSSSNAIIMSALQDIKHALLHPSPRTPIAPRSDSMTEALRQLVEVIENVQLPREPPAPLLRVPKENQTTTAPATQLPIPVSSPPPALKHHDLQDDTHSIRPVPNNDNRADAPTNAPTLIPPDIEPTTPKTVQWKPPANDPAIATTPRLFPKESWPTPTYGALTSPAVRATKRKARRLTNQTKQNMQQTAPRSKPMVLAPKRRSTRTTKPTYKKSVQANASSFTPLTDPHYCLHGTAINPDTGKVAEYPELLKSSAGHEWSDANDEEMGRMCTGLGPKSHMPTGTQTLEFIHRRDIPKDKVVTYVRIVCADRPEKAQVHRVRYTLGGDKIVYLGNKTTKTADIQTIKILLNSTISTPGARFATIDLKDFYLETDLPEPEYVRIPVSVLSKKIIDLYHLHDKIHKGFVYCKVKKGMYGLPQAGKLANDDLRQYLKPHGFIPCEQTAGLWKDTTSDLMFSLVVDDFGVRYTAKSNIERLITVLQGKYKTSVDWTGSRYIGMQIDWDYENGTVDISMPGYVERALQRFTHPAPTRHESSPHAWIAPVYGSRQQFATTDDSPFLDVKDQTTISEVVGTFLYYGRAIDLSMLPALGTIAAQQAQPTVNTMKAVTQFLNYAASNPDAKVRFYASGMHLYIESDASYLSESKARSRAAGYHYLGPAPTDLKNITPPPRNGAISVPCKILKNVLASAAEAELAGLFINGQEAIPERVTLAELGHPQGPTPLTTDNATANGIANDSIKQKRSKAMDMRFFWIRDRVRQGHFHVYWTKGSLNLSDYVTKHHPGKHHRRVRPAYFHTPTSNRFAPLTEL
ncbi:unnamed protein product [Cylindrotheca closterium]|uniref:Reverse transcriptase Ty1/copia-type domain-containing protein n=1 Tax=Cylindrotheca closterium TaxID=2856 RepID=A0AAD2CIG3_9STRA|nr:unnamed protein product [Cylindrotheca closterium]